MILSCCQQIWAVPHKVAGHSQGSDTFDVLALKHNRKVRAKDENMQVEVLNVSVTALISRVVAPSLFSVGLRECQVLVVDLMCLGSC